MKENKKELNENEIEKVSGGVGTVDTEKFKKSLEKYRNLITQKAHDRAEFFNKHLINKINYKDIIAKKEGKEIPNTTDIAKLPKE